MRYAPARLPTVPVPPHTRPQPKARPVAEHPILRLQQTAGNTAVQRLIQVQRDRADDERAARLAYAVSGGDWTGAASILLPADERWMVRQLRNLRADQLRYLDDAVRRMHVLNSRLRIFIHAGLMQLGATPDSAAPGAGYGEIEGKATEIKNGKLDPDGDNDSASYRFEITFMPNPAAVDATLIEFVQMAKVVSTVDSTPDAVGQPIPDDSGANGRDRETADHARIDRLSGKDQPWIGEKDSGRPDTSRLRPWHPGSSSPAWMDDTPSRSRPNVTFDFETAAVCRRGNDLGKVYATVRWGFTIDAAMKVIPKDTVYFNKESSDFDLAAAFWNAESERDDSTQKQLPTLH